MTPFLLMSLPGLVLGPAWAGRFRLTKFSESRGWSSESGVLRPPAGGPGPVLELCDRVAMKMLPALLQAGAVYFTAMAFAHFFGLKYPILFIYYDVPFYEYQDKIISFCSFTYACLFYAASQNAETVPAALMSMLATVLGLSYINASDALAKVLNGGVTTAYWAQTGLIAVYLIILSALHFSSSSPSATKNK